MTILVVEGAILAIEYGFRTWDLRKIYLDVLESNLNQFGRRLAKYAVLEGRLKAHQYVDGRYVDQLKYAIYADHWGRAGARLVAALAPRGSAALA